MTSTRPSESTLSSLRRFLIGQPFGIRRMKPEMARTSDGLRRTNGRQPPSGFGERLRLDSTLLRNRPESPAAIRHRHTDSAKSDWLSVWLRTDVTATGES